MKGFTLIELMAVIIILSMVLFIAIPTINSTIIHSKDSLSETQEKTIEKAAKEYVVTNYNQIDNKETNLDGKCIKFETLYENGYLKGSKEDLKKSEALDRKGVFISFDDSINQYKYEFKDEDCENELELETN